MSMTKGKSVSEIASSAFNTIKDQGIKYFSKFQNFASNISKSAKEKGGGLLEKAKGLVGIKTESDKSQIPKTKGLKNATDSANSIKGNFENVKQALSNLAEGIKYFANKDVLLGSLVLIPAGLGLVAMIPGFVGAKLIEKLNGEKIEQSLVGLANGLSQMASGRVLLGSGSLILASLGLLAMVPGIAVLAILGSMSALITSGLVSLSTGLTMFGTAAANPLFWIGIVAIGALGAAMIPFGYALSTLSPLVVAFGSAIGAAFSGIGEMISSIALGMTMFLGSVSLERAAGLVAVSSGIVLLSAAIIAFSTAMAASGWVSFFGGDGDGVIDKIMKLADAGPGLKIFADSITSMSIGIKEFASQLSDLENTEEKIDKFIKISNKISSTDSFSQGGLIETSSMEERYKPEDFLYDSHLDGPQARTLEEKAMSLQQVTGSGNATGVFEQGKLVQASKTQVAHGDLSYGPLSQDLKENQKIGLSERQLITPSQSAHYAQGPLSIDEGLSNLTVQQQHAIPTVRPLDMEEPEAGANVQPVHLRDISQTILRDKAANQPATGKLQSDELTRMEEASIRQVEELEQIKEGIHEMVALMKPTGRGSQASGYSDQIAGSTRDPRRPMHSATFGKMKYGKPGGNANSSVINNGEV